MLLLTHLRKTSNYEIVPYLSIVPTDCLHGWCRYFWTPPNHYPCVYCLSNVSSDQNVVSVSEMCHLRTFGVLRRRNSAFLLWKPIGALRLLPSLTKIGQASMNQVLMVVATKSCSHLFDVYPRIHVNRTLTIAATKFRLNFFCLNPYEASLSGCSHQVLFGFHQTNTNLFIFFLIYL